MIIYMADKLKKTNRKKSNALGKRAKNIEVKKGRTAKIYTMNIEKKRILKQRKKKKTLLNTKGRKLAEEYFLPALKASCKTHRALKIHKRARKVTMGL